MNSIVSAHFYTAVFLFTSNTYTWINTTGQRIYNFTLFAYLVIVCGMNGQYKLNKELEKNIWTFAGGSNKTLD
jgi:hypothetical protein